MKGVISKDINGYWSITCKASNGVNVSWDALDEITLSEPGNLNVRIPREDLEMILGVFRSRHPAPPAAPSPSLKEGHP